MVGVLLQRRQKSSTIGRIAASLLQISPFSHLLGLRLLVNARYNGHPYQKYTHNSGIFTIIQR
jgi:hypothetical protein